MISAGMSQKQHLARPDTHTQVWHEWLGGAVEPLRPDAPREERPGRLAKSISRYPPEGTPAISWGP
jgi:hypothetical protein